MVNKTVSPNSVILDFSIMSGQRGLVSDRFHVNDGLLTGGATLDRNWDKISNE